jgi:hypothetical protein
MDEPFAGNRLDPMWQRQFDTAARMPLAWLFSARQLWRVAETAYVIAYSAREEMIRQTLQEIEKNEQFTSRVLSKTESERLLDGSLLSVYGMLIAFAIENLAKGILIARHPGLIKSNGAIADSLKSHNLRKLCSDVFGDLSSEEKGLLDMLTDCGKWRGRYPIPLDWHDMKARQISTGEWVQPDQQPILQKRPLINSILERLTGLLQAIKIADSELEE